MDGNGTTSEARLERLESELALLKSQLAGLGTADGSLPALVKPAAGQEDRLSLIVFSGSLDRLIAAFVLATGAAAMGMRVSMFFTFWGTSALRRDAAHIKKSLLERMFGWMLPKGVRKLPLSQMNMGGGGPMMIRYVMKKKGVASVEEMMALAAELGVEVNICTMSMDLLGMKEAEMLEYPGLAYCGVAKFLETAAPGKITMFV
ncbi:MAG TPA: DsrE/DsrF/DrsH-like family protein [Polyangiaceae bacterium]|nr:DsrE/DsrF/DrsH-like family protein [Polyangiaceae bacterium]